VEAVGDLDEPGVGGFDEAMVVGGVHEAVDGTE